MENMKDAIERERLKPSMVCGSRHGMSKLTEEQVVEIRAMFREGIGGNTIAKKFGVSKNTVYFIRDGITWKSVS
jgi:transposase